jgi:hypothetical protein
MPRTKRVLSVVCAMVRLCGGLWPSALVENDFVVNFARGHGAEHVCSMLPDAAAFTAASLDHFLSSALSSHSAMALGFCRSDRPGP